MRSFFNIAAVFLIAASSQAAELHVAAAANLSTVLPDLNAAFERQTKIHIVPSLGATAQLTQQIENGAPFDVSLAPDVEHLDQLIRNAFVISDSRAIYARGQLVVWAPASPGLHTLEDLAKRNIRAIAIAKPELAPYGVAAIEALKNAGLWDKLEKKIVSAPSIATP
jgi:molybdate transport system substrate-binding protein